MVYIVFDNVYGVYSTLIYITWYLKICVLNLKVEINKEINNNNLKTSVLQCFAISGKYIIVMKSLQIHV